MLMKSPKLALAVATVAVATAGFNWSVQDKDKTLSATEIQKVLDDSKLKYETEKDEDDKSVYIIEKDDLRVILFQYGGEGDTASSVQMRATFQSEDKPDAAKLNTWNAERRYTKAYSDDEKNLILEQDLDLAATGSALALKKFIKEFLAEVPEFAKEFAE